MKIGGVGKFLTSIPNYIRKQLQIMFDLFGNEVVKDELLKDRFGIIPFSVLDTKTAEWKRRKKMWMSKGIQSELGRDDDLLGYGRIYSKGKPRLFDKKTSVFDPVLCELMYRWFCPKGGKILDPFSGGSVRGIVANYLGYDYCGIDLRSAQVESNIIQAETIVPNNVPTWIVGDSDFVVDKLDAYFDFIFTCPPYFDLEKYSDEVSDLSNMSFELFCDTYKSIITKTLSRLKNNRFACIVIGDVRDKDRKRNWYRDLISFTKTSFCSSDDVHLYNDIILLDNIGTAAMRVEQAFSKRKLVKVHQNVLIFYKGQDVNDIITLFND